MNEEEFQLTDAQQEQYLENIRAGMQRGAAADEMGLNRRKVREYIAEDSEFATAVADAEVDATEHVQEALYQAAISGSVPAAKTWLELNGTGRPASGAVRPGPAPAAPDDPFGDLDNVEALDPRRRRRQAE